MLDWIHTIRDVLDQWFCYLDLKIYKKKLANQNLKITLFKLFLWAVHKNFKPPSFQFFVIVSDSKIVKQNVTYDTTTGKVYEELGSNNNNSSNNNNNNTQRSSYFQVKKQSCILQKNLTFFKMSISVVI